MKALEFLLRYFIDKIDSLSLYADFKINFSDFCEKCDCLIDDYCDYCNERNNKEYEYDSDFLEKLAIVEIDGIDKEYLDIEEVYAHCIHMDTKEKYTLSFNICGYCGSPPTYDYVKVIIEEVK